MIRFMSLKLALAVLAAAACGPGVQAQLVPPVGDILDTVDRLGDDALRDVRRTADETGRAARRLVRQRLSRLRRHVRRSGGALEMSADGPAVRGEILALDAGEEGLVRAREVGFRLLSEERIEGLDIAYVRLGIPEGLSVDEAGALLEMLGLGGEAAPDHIYFTSGTASLAIAAQSALAGGTVSRPAIGIVDGGVARHPSLSGGVEQRGFARGAPIASEHGTAVASLAAGRGAIDGGAPGVALLVADIYGNDPAGGSASAVARAIGWMAQRRVPVVTLSIAGPANPLVGEAVRRARARGILFVAAVGNDGPAAPSSYPASFPGVIAVTGVDRRNRVLPEAGRAAHLDYAAPGADMRAASARGGARRVRGTSFAAPLVAGRLAALGSRARLDAEAQDLGERGPDDVYGRGLICGNCRNSD